MQYFFRISNRGILAIGDSPVRQLHELKTDLGVFSIIKQRKIVFVIVYLLFYHWQISKLCNKRFGGTINPIDLNFLREWSQAEAMLDKFEIFLVELQKAQES